MLGYSDSAKDAGFLAANLALYRAQGRLAAWAAGRGIDLALFHGRGGALGRGGGPAGRAVRGQAPGSVAGRFKVTEQGEVIYARYGNLAIGHRHLEQVTNAVLGASTPLSQAAVAAAEDRYLPTAAAMASAAEAAWRGLVEKDGFAEFFARVTPIKELGLLRIGSRPARRQGAGGPGPTGTAWPTCGPSPGCSPGARTAATCPAGTAWAVDWQPSTTWSRPARPTGSGRCSRPWSTSPR